MGMMAPVVFDYSDGRTKQAFKDSCDINKILKKAQLAGGLSHALKYPEAVYGEFTGIDLLSAFGQIKRANAIFDDLPSEVRREFKGDALAFAGFASNPANIGRLQELLPAIAEPGSYFPNPAKRTEPPVAAIPAAPGAGPPAPSASVVEPPEAPVAPSEPVSSSGT